MPFTAWADGVPVTATGKHGPRIIPNPMPGPGRESEAERHDANTYEYFKRRVKAKYSDRVYCPRLRCMVLAEKPETREVKSPRKRRKALIPQHNSESPHRFTAYCRETGARLWTVQGSAREALKEFSILAKAQGGSLADLIIRS